MEMVIEYESNGWGNGETGGGGITCRFEII